MTGYAALTFRAWTQESLAVKIQKALEAYGREEIVSVNIGADWWLFNRHRAVVVVSRLPE